MSEENKAMVRRMVEAINAREEGEVVEELFTPRAARRVGRLFAEFRSAFPDWHEEVVQLVAEGDTVAGRFKCSGTHLGEFLGEAPTGRRMEVEEVFFLRAEGGRLAEFWGLEDSPWAGCGSSASFRKSGELPRTLLLETVWKVAGRVGSRVCRYREAPRRVPFRPLCRLTGP